jgi:hypothetical protein
LVNGNARVFRIPGRQFVDWLRIKVPAIFAERISMPITVRLANLARGTALAVTKRYPTYTVLLEYGVGLLIIAGLGLLGASLPFIP